ncbi:MAG TPA: shikimate kinase [Humisphaera sp.]
MSVFLIGYRGSGKTTIGRRLADRLWQTFVDADELVVKQAAGRTIKEIFEIEGEAGFRDRESAVVRELALLADHVVALGGGAVLRPENREALKAGGHKVIYLRCEPDELHRRIHADPATAANRPALTALGGGIDEVKRLLAERESIYRQVMTAELDVTNLSPEDATTYISRML